MTKLQDDAEERTPERWVQYYDKLMGQPPRRTLLKAIELHGQPGGFAIDLGCGVGNDSLALLRHGWRVLAIDAQAEALSRLTSAAPPEHQSRLRTEVAEFETVQLPAADLVNASFALPFCPPPAFERLWSEIEGALRDGGRFAGQFFGDRDSWAARPDMTCHSAAEVHALLANFQIEYFEEEDAPQSQTALGRPKHWHIFWVVARHQS